MFRGCHALAPSRLRGPLSSLFVAPLIQSTTVAHFGFPGGVRQPNGRLGLAARPGTSNHGLGRAVDVNLGTSPGASDWLRKNGARYGFHTIPREPWHWEFRG